MSIIIPGYIDLNNEMASFDGKLCRYHNLPYVENDKTANVEVSV